jgi:hypothetical protein
MDGEVETVEATIPEAISCPGAMARHRWVSSFGIRIASCEWGDEEAPPLFLVHGGSDFAGTFDAFAPLLAVQAGG